VDRREHALLAYAFGVEELIVGINKMDDKTVAFSEARSTEIRTEVSKFLGKIGFNTKEMDFIPTSA
jgi:translation elongation factor EF-1alpha